MPNIEGERDTTHAAASRVALVIGGAGGIGSAIVRRLADAGHPVAIGYGSSRERAEALAREIATRGGRATAVACDVQRDDAVRACIDEVSSLWGAPLVLVNSAGTRVTKSLSRHEPQEWERVLRINLTGPFLAMRLALAGMLGASWGRIVNVGSPVGTHPFPGAASYGASKAGLHMLTRVLALEVARHGVTVNAVLPGLVTSDFVADAPGELLETVAATQAAGRAVDPDQVAAAVAFLTSDDAAMINGQLLAIDGGGFLPFGPKRFGSGRASAGERPPR